MINVTTLQMRWMFLLLVGIGMLVILQESQTQWIIQFLEPMFSYNENKKDEPSNTKNSGFLTNVWHDEGEIQD